MSNLYSLRQLQNFLEIPRQTASGWVSDIAPFRTVPGKLYTVSDFLVLGVVKELDSQLVTRPQIRKYAKALCSALDDIPLEMLPGPLLYFHRQTFEVGFVKGSLSIDQARSLDKVVEIDRIAMAIHGFLTRRPGSRWLKAHKPEEDDAFLSSRLIKAIP